MGLRDRLGAGLARQLGHPSGVRGRVVGLMLNRANRAVVAAAIDALALAGGETVADVGFGGGVGIRLLLERVGPSGTVDGVDISTEMLNRAGRRYRDQCAAGSVRLHAGSLTDLPLPDDSLDAAISVNTIYFVDDLERALGELARALKPSGRLVIGLGDPEAMARIPYTAHGFRVRPVADVVKAFSTAGIPVREHRRVGSGEGAFHLLVATTPASA